MGDYFSGGAAHSSKDMTWATPRAMFDKLDEMFGPFSIDVAASSENALCADYFTEESDALSRDWEGRVWCNPPYGRTLHNWMRHAYEQRNNCEIIVVLVPARTDTSYWRDWVFDHADEVLFVNGRLAFGDGSKPAPFGSAVVIYRPDRVKTTYGTIERAV